MSDLNDKINEFTDTPDTTEEYDPEDINKNKVMAILSYLSWLVLIPLIAGRESKFVKFHVNQGIVLAISELIALFIVRILKGLPYIGFVFGILGSAVTIVCLILAVIGMVNASNGKAKELPLVGKIRLIK